MVKGDGGRGLVEGRGLSSQFQNDLEPTHYSTLFVTGSISGRNVGLTTHLQLKVKVKVNFTL